MGDGNMRKEWEDRELDNHENEKERWEILHPNISRKKVRKPVKVKHWFSDQTESEKDSSNSDDSGW